MKWKKFTLITKADAVDLISASFDEIGIEGIEIEDNIPLTDKETKGMFIDILPQPKENDESARVSFYLEPDADIEGILKRVDDALDELELFIDLGERKIIEDETEDKDWINNWKSFFKPFLIEDILIKPTWEIIADDINYNTLIQIDPGTAFGTGSHETTKLCILQLRKHIENIKNIKSYMEAGSSDTDIKVLDLGTGSGILGIAALKLGANYVLGTDLDEIAIEAVKENIKVNDINENTFDLICGDIVEEKSVQDSIGYEKYDIVTANILAPVIILIQKNIARHMKKGALFISSGIIDSKEQEVCEAIRANQDLEIVEINHLGEWVNITARRK